MIISDLDSSWSPVPCDQKSFVNGNRPTQGTRSFDEDQLIPAMIGHFSCTGSCTVSGGGGGSSRAHAQSFVSQPGGAEVEHRPGGDGYELRSVLGHTVKNAVPLIQTIDLAKLIHEKAEREQHDAEEQDLGIALQEVVAEHDEV